LRFLRDCRRRDEAESADITCRRADFLRISLRKELGRQFAIRPCMSRRKRTVVEGLTVHVTNRGNNKMVTFREEQDYETFLWFLRFATVKYKLRVHSYAVMSNHFHLMVTPETPMGLSRGLQSLGRRYVRYFNDRYDRTGTLWEGRFRSALIVNERYWLTCLRYVEMNPVRAGIVELPESYCWSSYRAHAFGVRDPIVAPHAVFEGLATTADRRQEAWRQMCVPAMQIEQLAALRRSITDGIVVGESLDALDVCTT
jgi:putative transposase